LNVFLMSPMFSTRVVNLTPLDLFIILIISNSVAPEPAGSSQYSQYPAAGPYPEPTGSTLHSPSQSP
jgi:hypothetical protein